MSGPKCAEVRPLLPTLITQARRTIQHIRASAHTRNLDLSNHQASETQADSLQRSMSATTISATVSKYAPEDATQLAAQRKQVDELIATGKRETQRVDDLRREAEGLQASAQRQLNGAGSTWQVDDALRLEREAADKLQAAVDYGRQAKNAFDSAISIGNKFTQNASNAQRIAAERETAARIAEENQRNATSSNSEIGGLTGAINSLNHEKFAPGEFRPLSAEIETFRRAYSSNDFATASKIGEGLSKRLRAFEQKVSSLQTAFETAKTSAQNALTAAKQEIAPLDKNELIRWSGEDTLIVSAYSQLDAAARMIVSEQFSEAESAVEVSLNDLRRVAKIAANNKVAAEQRFDLAEVIMNALYEQKYDTPTYYYAHKKQDGSEVEFSDLTIFARAPGNRGNMRMKINLEGKVNLEVEGIAEGDETKCVQAIQDLQKSVGEKIEFQMTDWGRGDKAKPKEVAITQKEPTREITREVHRG